MNQQFIESGAYLRIESQAPFRQFDGMPLRSINREKLVFFKRDAEKICQAIRAASGHYRFNLSLVRTLFTAELKTYPTQVGPSKYTAFTPQESVFSKWYAGKIGIGEDQIKINAPAEASCEQSLNKAAEHFEKLMRSAPDVQSFWFEAY